MSSTTEKAKAKSEQQQDLTEALEDSFPASDPPSMTQPKPHAGAPEHKSTSTGTEAELARQQKDAQKK
ncbi:MAG: hypothetical protein K2X62_05740 [Beijerinckiaceae bacterium]|jgi:hypothetical protein|nr:hypothetical protein [Beijerinckiaceae bacterium]